MKCVNDLVKQQRSIFPRVKLQNSHWEETAMSVCYILGPEHRVHSDCRFVQDEQLWVLKQSRSERHPTPLTPTVTHRKQVRKKSHKDKISPTVLNVL